MKIEGDMQKSVYLWHRDSLPGGLRHASIIEPMDGSKKIIIVQTSTLFDSILITSTGNVPNPDQLNDAANLDDIAFEVSNPNEWTDFALITALHFMMEKDICVIKHGRVPAARSINKRWHTLLYPNTFLSPVVSVLDSSLEQFRRQLELFLFQ